MSNGIVFDIPRDGIKEDDFIFLELTKDCDVETARMLSEAFQGTYPKADVIPLHPSVLKSVRFFHKENKKENHHPDLLPF